MYCTTKEKVAPCAFASSIGDTNGPLPVPNRIEQNRISPHSQFLGPRSTDLAYPRFYRKYGSTENIPSRSRSSQTGRARISPHSQFLGPRSTDPAYPRLY